LFQSLKRDNCLSNNARASAGTRLLAGFNRSSATIASPTMVLQAFAILDGEFQSLKRDNCLSNGDPLA